MHQCVCDTFSERNFTEIEIVLLDAASYANDKFHIWILCGFESLPNNPPSLLVGKLYANLRETIFIQKGSIWKKSIQKRILSNFKASSIGTSIPHVLLYLSAWTQKREHHLSNLLFCPFLFYFLPTVKKITACPLHCIGWRFKMTIFYSVKN